MTEDNVLKDSKEKLGEELFYLYKTIREQQMIAIKINMSKSTPEKPRIEPIVGADGGQRRHRHVIVEHCALADDDVGSNDAVRADLHGVGHPGGPVDDCGGVYACHVLTRLDPPGGQKRGRRGPRPGEVRRWA